MIETKISKEEKQKINNMLDNKTWSFSSVNCYKNCPKCFYLSYLQDPPLTKDENAFAEWGTLGHSLFERFAKNELELYELSEAYKKEYPEKVTLGFPPNKYVDLNTSYYESGLNYFENFDGFPDNWEIIDSEREIHLKIGDSVFVGYIDLLIKDKTTGEYIVVDHKSKLQFKDDRERDEYARQLYLYALHVKEEFGVYPSYLIFNMFRSNEVKTTPFDEKSLLNTVEWCKNTLNDIKNDTKFDDKITILFKQKNKPLKSFTKNDFFCNYLCSVRSHCNRSKDYKRK